MPTRTCYNCKFSPMCMIRWGIDEVINSHEESILFDMKDKHDEEDVNNDITQVFESLAGCCTVYEIERK